MQSSASATLDCCAQSLSLTCPTIEHCCKIIRTKRNGSSNNSPYPWTDHLVHLLHHLSKLHLKVQEHLPDSICCARFSQPLHIPTTSSATLAFVYLVLWTSHTSHTSYSHKIFWKSWFFLFWTGVWLSSEDVVFDWHSIIWRVTNMLSYFSFSAFLTIIFYIRHSVIGIPCNFTFLSFSTWPTLQSCTGPSTCNLYSWNKSVGISR